MGNVIDGRAALQGEAFDFGSIERQRQEILDRTKAEARSILEAARAEAEVARTRAREEGQREGRETGLEEGRKEGHDEARAEAIERFAGDAKSAIEALTALLAELEARREDLRRHADENLLRLAMEVARKVIGREVELDQEPVRENLRRAVGLLVERGRVDVRCHPSDLDTLEGFAPALMNEIGALESVQVQPDRTISRGGVVVEGGAGIVDLRVQTQIAAIERVLYGEPPAEAGAESPVVESPDPIEEEPGEAG